MSDLGSFAVQSEDLRQHAGLWADRAADAGTAGDDIAAGVGQGYAFGVLAGSCGVSEAYDDWSQAMSRCLTDAAQTFTYLATALRSTANLYDGADETTALDLAALETRLA